MQFRLTLATDQASKDSINAQITQLNAEYLIPIYLGYVFSGEKAGFCNKTRMKTELSTFEKVAEIRG